MTFLLQPTRHLSTTPARQRLRSLAWCIGAALPLCGTTQAQAPRGIVHAVTTCADAGSGSLREAAALAIDGDTLDMSGLACSRITLSSGAIAIGQDSSGAAVASIELIGPGRNALTIDGNYLDRVFVHTGGAAGVFTLSGVTVLHGRTDGDGGCVHLAGDAVFTDVAIKECTADMVGSTRSGTTGEAPGRGGGVFVGGRATLQASTVSDNKLLGGDRPVLGGGVYAYGDLSLVDTAVVGNYARSESAAARGGGVVAGSPDREDAPALLVLGGRIAQNTAYSACAGCDVQGGGAWISGGANLSGLPISGNSSFSAASIGVGGALYAGTDENAAVVLDDVDLSSNSSDQDGGALAGSGDIRMTRVRLSGNSANGNGGALMLDGGSLVLTDGLVQGNVALGGGGGVFVTTGRFTATNSTIAENIALSNGGGIGNLAGEIVLTASTVAWNIANGSGGGIHYVLPFYPLTLVSSLIGRNEVGGAADDIGAPGLKVGGADNLVQAPGVGLVLPPGTLIADPQIEPLADNGGGTRTCALTANSPAIDAGNNDAGAPFDQRGSGFVRVHGERADIGAYEAQPDAPDDRIFGDGFEA